MDVHVMAVACVANRFIHSEDSECRSIRNRSLLDCGVLHAEACPECGNRAFQSPTATAGD